MQPSFQLSNPIISPTRYGHLMFMTADVEYWKDNIHVADHGKVSVQFYTGFLQLIGDEEKVKLLLGYYVVENLKKILTVPNPILRHNFEPSEPEYNELRMIDIRKIHPFEIIEIKESLPTQTKRIFISCGQFSQNEKEVGKEIKQIIDHTDGFEGYFAEDQQSFEGVTLNIFNALHKSVAFIAVMHRRGQISENQYRGSVWIEQEIAIAAFMKQTLGIPINVLAYIQDGIKLEGIREKIILNPQSFLKDEDVLADIKNSLPQFLAKINTS